MKQSKISLGIIIIVIVALAIVTSGVLTLVPSSINFAGFTWWQDIHNECDPNKVQCPTTYFFAPCGTIELSGEKLVISGSASGSTNNPQVCNLEVQTEQPINNIDEMLVIFDSQHQSEINSGSQLIIKLRSSTQPIAVVGVDPGSYALWSQGVSSAASRYYEPNIVKIKNNFDGTYSVLTSLGVGDVFIERKKIAVGSEKLYLNFRIETGSESKSSGTATFYNIVRKENAFAICKADEYITTDSLGKFICKPLSTIVLNSEEAIKESFNEKIARITIELEAKNSGLTADITALKKQLVQQSSQQPQSPQQPTLNDAALVEKLNFLESELKETKAVLADVKARDKNVIIAVQAQEQFKNPSFIARLFNKIVSFIKSLFM